MKHPASVAHITFHKCGSQWVRDVLSAPEIANHSGVHLFHSGQNLARRWPEQPAGSFLGPLYRRTPEEWKHRQSPGLKGLVVLRDPRDRVLSWLFHCTYGGEPSPDKQVISSVMLQLPLRQRLYLAMVMQRDDNRLMMDWSSQVTDEGTYVVRYDDLVLDPLGGFGRIIDFLGWDVPAKVVVGVVDRLSFAKRSGRQPGEANNYSHYRKGVSGDWRNYFDAEAGAMWESLLPGGLVELGYEASSNWHENLPACPALQATPDNPYELAARAASLQAELVRAGEINAELGRNMAHWETAYRKLAAKQASA